MINSISKGELKQYTNFLKVQNYNPKTIYLYLLYIKKFNNTNPKQQEIINYLVEHNNIVCKSALKSFFLAFKQKRNIKIPSRKGKAKIYYPRSLTKKEVYQIMESFDKEIYRVLTKLLFHSGIRIFEALQLTPKDFDFDINEVFIRGKQNKERVGIYDDTTKKALLNYITSEKLGDDDLLFPRNRTYVWRIYHEKGQKILNKKIGCHTFRHSTAQHLANLGWSDDDISFVLGWTDSRPAKFYRKKNKQLIKTKYMEDI